MRKALLDNEIELARKLKEQEGFTNRKIAYVFCVGKTTIWDAIYKKKKNRIRFINVRRVVDLKHQDYTSREVADMLGMKLEDVNDVFSNYR